MPVGPSGLPADEDQIAAAVSVEEIRPVFVVKNRPSLSKAPSEVRSEAHFGVWSIR